MVKLSHRLESRNQLLRENILGERKLVCFRIILVKVVDQRKRFPPNLFAHILMHSQPIHHCDECIGLFCFFARYHITSLQKKFVKNKCGWVPDKLQPIVQHCRTIVEIGNCVCYCAIVWTIVHWPCTIVPYASTSRSHGLASSNFAHRSEHTGTALDAPAGRWLPTLSSRSCPRLLLRMEHRPALTSRALFQDQRLAQREREKDQTRRMLIRWSDPVKSAQNHFFGSTSLCECSWFGRPWCSLRWWCWWRCWCWIPVSWLVQERSRFRF